MPAQKRPAPRTVGLVLFPGCMPVGLFGTRDLLAAASARRGASLFDVTWVGVDREPVRVEGGLALRPDATIGRHDIYVVPGTWDTDPAAVAATVDRSPLVRRLAALPPRTEVWAWCTGVAWLAAAGRLDARRATATWWLRPLLEARHRRVRWAFDEPLVEDRGVASAAGPYGHLPLVTAQLARHLSPDELDDVRQALVLPLPRSLHPIFHELDLMSAHTSLRPLVAAALRTAARDLSLTTMAVAQRVSQRTLRRRIETASGLSAGTWLRRVKLRQAADHLARTAMSIKEVAARTGYTSESGFSRTFVAEVGLTPVAFRRRHGRLA